MTTSPKTMTAIVIEGKGGPEVLIPREMPMPLPGPGQLPGRLRAFVLEPGHESDFQTAPGDDGYNLYSLRHTGFGVADAGRHLLAGLGAESLGAGPDEFGEVACRFRAPDGYEWLGLPAV